MFNLAIDSKLRGCDVVALRVEDVAPSGSAVDRATVRQTSGPMLMATAVKLSVIVKVGPFHKYMPEINC